MNSKARVMYLHFYQLDRAPFTPSAGPEVLWAGKNYQKSLEALKYGLTHHSGLSLFTGNPGSGKTTVIQAVLRALEQTVLAAVIPDSSLNVQEFYELVAHSLALPGKIDNRLSFHEHLQTLLQKAGEQNKQVLLVIDEAQQLSVEVIEEIDALVNLHPQESGGLNICLIGQVGNASGLGAQVIQAFENHVMVRYHLGPFTSDETEGYIRLRLQVAGAKRDIFDKGAIQAVHRYSEGYPGQINIICDLALYSGFIEKISLINAAIIKAGAEKLQFPTAGGGIGAAAGGDAPAGPIDSSSRPKRGRQKDIRRQGKGREAISTTKKKVKRNLISGNEASHEKTATRSFAVPAVALLLTLLLAGGGYVYFTKRVDGVPAVVPVSSTSAVQPVVDEQTSYLEPAPEKEQVGSDTIGHSGAKQDIPVHEQPVTLQTTNVSESESAESVSADNLVLGDTNEAEPKSITAELSAPQKRVEVKELQVEESSSSIPVAGAPPVELENRVPVVSETTNSLKPSTDEAMKALTAPRTNEVEPAAVEKQVVQASALREEPIPQSAPGSKEEKLNKGKTEKVLSIPPIGMRDGTLVDQPLVNEEQEVADEPPDPAELRNTDPTSLDSITEAGTVQEDVAGTAPSEVGSVPLSDQGADPAADTLAGKEAQVMVETQAPTTLTEAGSPIIIPVAEAGGKKKDVAVAVPSVAGSVASADREKEEVTGTIVVIDAQKPMDALVPAKQRKGKLQEFLGAGSFVEPAVSAPEKLIKNKAPIQSTSPAAKQGKVSIGPEVEPAPDPSNAIDWVLKKKEQQNISAH